MIILGHENPDVDSIVSGYLLEKNKSLFLQSSDRNATTLRTHRLGLIP